LTRRAGYAPPRFGTRRGGKGFALVTVIWGLGLMTLLILSYLSTARLRLQTAFNLAGATRADLLADAAIGASALSLLAERDAKDVQPERPIHDGAPHICALDDAAVTISIEEESGKVDLNAASFKLLQAFFTGLDVDAREVDAIAAGIVAFRTPPDNAAASNVVYADPGDKPFGLKRAPFQSVAELDQAPGVSQALYRLASRFVTVHSRSSGVDSKAAPPALFAALAGFNQQDVQALVEAPFPNGLDRKDPRFPSNFQRNGDGGAFLARVEVALPTGQSSVREAVIDFRETSGAPYLIKEIRRGRGRNLVRPRGAIEDRPVALPGCG
jgi:general secretion pathway protein K